jgi:hypothetical protein
LLTLISRARGDPAPADKPDHPAGSTIARAEVEHGGQIATEEIP